MEPNTVNSNPVILFDGICNLCNSSVNYVIDHDPQGYFKFGALQSEEGQRYLKKHNLDAAEFDSVILIENGRVHSRSAAALRIARKLKGPVKCLWLLIAIPPFIRDPVYEWIASNRYRWFGKRNECRVPTPELTDRFI